MRLYLAVVLIVGQVPPQPQPSVHFPAKIEMTQQSLPNGTDISKPIQLSFPLPRSQETRIHIHLTSRAKSLLLFLATTAGEGSNTAPVGSFVYALPNVKRSPSMFFDKHLGDTE
jgi:hypothetical protein